MCSIVVGAVRVASIRIAAATTASPKRSRRTVRWSIPLSCGTTSGGSVWMVRQRLAQAGRLDGDDQRVDVLVERRRGTRALVQLAEPGAR